MRRGLVMAAGTVAVVLATTASALAVSQPRAKGVVRHFSQTEAGSRLSATGLRYEDVYRIKRSPDGQGTTIRDAVLKGTVFPVSGTATATSYFRDGRLNAIESFTLGPPHIDGIGPITGTGRCIGGTEVHQKETCSYTLKGSYDLQTGITLLTLKGTLTPAGGGKPTKK